MHRRVMTAPMATIVAVTLAAACLLLPAPAYGQYRDSPAAADDADSAAAADGEGARASSELGVHVGLDVGGRVTPGGLRLGGSLLYRLSDVDWFEGGIDVIVGSGSAVCFTDRQGEFVCDHGPVAGRGAEVSAGIRRYLRPEELFTPYVRARAGVRVVSLPGDDVRGLAIPISAAVGVRGRAHRLVTVGGEIGIAAGVGFFDHELGAEPSLGLTVLVGAEIRLD